MRDNWNVYFMKLAHLISTRSTCNRKSVGCLLVKDKNIIATGYNGSINGMEHCDDVGHLIEEGHCQRVLHSEQNALCQAAKNGISVKDAVIYVNVFPCFTCFKLLLNSGISKIYYDEMYGNFPKDMQKRIYHINGDLSMFDIHDNKYIYLEKIHIG
jgi:dCMP deaminase